MKKHPPVGRARHELQRRGYTGIIYKRKGDHPTHGPVLIFEGDFRGEHHGINVYESSVGDRLEVIAAIRPVSRANPRVRQNPRRDGVEEYDPRLEMIRAQRQAIYEQNLMKLLDGGDFRDSGGMRFDAFLWREGETNTVLSHIKRFMFQMGTGVQARTGYLKPGTQQPTAKAVEKAYERYRDYDKLLLNRQDYEETLGLGRKSGFYRVTKEPTARGARYFVWPMPPGAQVPKGWASAEEAKAVALKLNRTADPRGTGVWWEPPARPYGRKELQHWLPSDSIFRP